LFDPWRGFHIRFDDADDLIGRLRMRFVLAYLAFCWTTIETLPQAAFASLVACFNSNASTALTGGASADRSTVVCPVPNNRRSDARWFLERAFFYTLEIICVDVETPLNIRLSSGSRRFSLPRFRWPSLMVVARQSRFRLVRPERLPREYPVSLGKPARWPSWIIAVLVVG